jgi:hypothetical protein
MRGASTPSLCGYVSAQEALDGNLLEGLIVQLLAWHP